MRPERWARQWGAFRGGFWRSGGRQFEPLAPQHALRRHRKLNGALPRVGREESALGSTTLSSSIATSPYVTVFILRNNNFPAGLRQLMALGPELHMSLQSAGMLDIAASKASRLRGCPSALALVEYV
ncbi:hypothetical protein T492DRAFT_837589 [Pavlovales sp. CCMP2436]|nr:hypothetical protein T492DRAFT_837589 [Pavlovales sp. CCMP2436]